MTAAKILVVDDEVDVQELIKRRFRREMRDGEFEFSFATDGEEALSVLSNGADVDVVLSDINMPRMDGLTLLERLTDLHRDLKTIMVSAYGDMDNIRTAMNRGAFDFVTKPIDFGDLLVTIRRTLDELGMLRDIHAARAEAEAARGNLSRYFPPNLVDTLAGLDDPFGEPREQSVAVMFVDIVGFTSLASTLAPTETFRMLREFHGRMAQAVFDAGGTLDKFIGDGVMATFGTPRTGTQDATNALRCALGMLDAIDDIRVERRAGGAVSIRGAIGIHYGPVMLGNIGDERRLEFATIGDTVNIASRLEELARPLEAKIVISDALADAVRAENETAPPELEHFKQVTEQTLRGLDSPMPVWTYEQR